MKILERPTLEEVIEHFKGVEVVKCLSDGLHYNIIAGDIEFDIGCYWMDLLDEVVAIWNDSQGYAKIIK